MTSPCKQQRLSSFIVKFSEEIDTELKAVCYDISTKNGGQAIKSIEKIRRKVKAMHGKVTTLVHLNDNENAKLAQENSKMKREIESLKKKINQLEEDDFYLSLEDSIEPATQDSKPSTSTVEASGKKSSSPGQF